MSARVRSNILRTLKTLKVVKSFLGGANQHINEGRRVLRSLDTAHISSLPWLIHRVSSIVNHDVVYSL